jgi:hypothetical protein
MAQVIATRNLARCLDGTKVTITLFAPVQDVDGEDWECSFEVDGKGLSGRGVDSLQALVEALRGIKHVLDHDDTKLTWLSGKPKDTGIPRVLPYDDPDFAELLGALVDAEMQRRYVYAERKK